MLRILSVLASVGSALAGTILWDGRFNEFSSSTDLNNWSWGNQVGPYQYYIVRWPAVLVFPLHLLTLSSTDRASSLIMSISHRATRTLPMVDLSKARRSRSPTQPTGTARTCVVLSWSLKPALLSTADMSSTISASSVVAPTHQAWTASIRSASSRVTSQNWNLGGWAVQLGLATSCSGGWLVGRPSGARTGMLMCGTTLLMKL